MQFNRFKKVLGDESFDFKEYPFLEVLELINGKGHSGAVSIDDYEGMLPLCHAKTLKTLIIRGTWSLNTYSVVDCDSLQKIIWIDDDGKSICKKDAFKQLPALREIILPKKMLEISSKFFSDCDSIKFIQYPEIIEKCEFNGLGGVIKNYPEVMVNGNLSRDTDSSREKIIAFRRPVTKLYAITTGCPESTILRLQNGVDMPIKQADNDRIISASSFLSCKSLTPYTSKGVSRGHDKDFESVWLDNECEANLYDLD